MGEIKLGTDGYRGRPPEVDTEGKEYDSDVVDL